MMTPKIVTSWLRGDAEEPTTTQRPANQFPESAQQAASRGPSIDRMLMEGQFAVAVLALLVGSALFVGMVKTSADAVARPFAYHAPALQPEPASPRTIAPPVAHEAPSVRPEHPESATWDSWMLEGAIDLGETSELEAMQAARNARRGPGRQSARRCSDLCIVLDGDR